MTADEETRLCAQVLELTRQQLLDALPQLGGALAALPWKPDEKPGFRLEDGTARFRPETLLRIYAAQPEALLRGFLHMLLHCLYLHPFSNHAGEALWDTACDLTVERIIEGLALPGWEKKPPILPELGRQPLTAQQIYGYLRENAPDFDGSPYAFDDHSSWKDAPGETSRRKWEALLLAATGDKTGVGKRGHTAGAGLENAEDAQAGQFDYRRYLERFAELREEMQLDMESFDYAYYRLGLDLGTPFLEPLEYQEVRRLEELVIAIDTSGSCDKETVSRFLAETWKLLSNQENFFRKMNVYFLQCDCVIQDVTRIQSREDWLDYAKKVVIQGRGGTDFTPVFNYVEKLRQTRQLKRLRALLYFTDGDGFYPTQPPDYETAFVLLKDSGHPELVPKWAHCFQI